MRATATAEESTFAGVIRLVEAAHAAKAPIARLADQLAAGVDYRRETYEFNGSAAAAAAAESASSGGYGVAERIADAASVFVEAQRRHRPAVRGDAPVRRTGAQRLQHPTRVAQRAFRGRVEPPQRGRVGDAGHSEFQRERREVRFGDLWRPSRQELHLLVTRPAPIADARGHTPSAAAALVRGVTRPEFAPVVDHGGHVFRAAQLHVFGACLGGDDFGVGHQLIAKHMIAIVMGVDHAEGD